MRNWTESQIATLKVLWAKGISSTRIAADLGAGFTRSSVIAKSHRLGLARRRIPSRNIPVRPKRPTKTPKARNRWARPETPAPMFSIEPLPPEPPKPATALRLTLLQLTDATCKCGLGDPKAPDFAFCGLPVRTGSRYCAAHHPLMYTSISTYKPRKAPRHEAPVDNRFDRWAA